ncbi:rhoptry-associated protein, putative [Theileria equi strain WA]|uniref:Rhoptry-associated protein, putative n=1 Tax=Theileria equi strain WA TaxID=1537102 RepID=L1LEL5_THEEQ|nr:rhoptry-associated protein, putative [Theileria equi strain WA]EKX73724.1 rhoptry-associated protein, putative [Theileria equi strain WA]|eukprot:XP_004833176.1 rhoptry-associated protein, putative [Theileria equi strain WA]
MRVQVAIKSILPLFVLLSNGVLSVKHSGHRPLQPSDFFSRRDSDFPRDHGKDGRRPFDSDSFSEYSEPKQRRKSTLISPDHPLHTVEDSVRYVDDKLRTVDKAIRKWESSLTESFDKVTYDTEAISNIGPVMSSYLKSDEKKLLSEFKGSKSCERVIGKYVNRCKQGDCFTLDNMNMFGAGDRMSIALPPLCQLNFAIELFKKSDAYDNPEEIVLGVKGIVNLALGRVLSNRMLQAFADQILKANIGNIYYMSKHEEIMNKFIYTVTLFYKTHIAESTIAPTLNEFLVLRPVFIMQTKSRVITIADKLFHNSGIAFGKEDIHTITESFIRYLSTDRELYENLVIYFARVCKNVLISASKGDRVMKALSSYLKNHSIVEKICKKNDTDCEDAVNSYVKRCLAGDCYTFDNIKVYDETPQLSVSLPNLDQVDAAFYTFRHSKAQGYRILNLIKKVFRCKPHKTLRHFITILAAANTEKMYFSNHTQAFVNGFLYESTLYYRRFLYISYLKGFYNLNKFTLAIFRLVKIRHMKRMAEALSKKKIIVVPDVFNGIFKEFSAYLFVRRASKYKKLTNFYVRLCKEAAGVALEGDNITLSMAEYLTTHDDIAQEVCRIGDGECKGDIEKYVQRCKVGDCYTFDNIKIYDDEANFAIFLPNLNQVDAAFTIFKHCAKDYIEISDKILSFALGGVSERTLKFTRVLLTMNLKKLNPINFTHRVVNNFLYHATIYYKATSSQRFINSISGGEYMDKPVPISDMENHLNKALSHIANSDRITMERDHLISVLKKYRNYLIESLAPGNDGRIKDFSFACYNIIKQYIAYHSE